MKRVFVVMAAAGVAVLLAGPVWADSGPTLASGSFVGTSATQTCSRLADGNTICVVRLAGVTSGTFSGPFRETDRDVIHPDGSVTAEGKGTQGPGMAGSCGMGSFNYETQAKGMLTVVNGVPVLTFTGRFLSLDEAGETVTPMKVHTVDTFVASGPLGTYSGTYHCT